MLPTRVLKADGNLLTQAEMNIMNGEQAKALPPGNPWGQGFGKCFTATTIARDITAALIKEFKRA